MSPADFHVAPGLYTGVFPVRVIHLELDKIHIRVKGEQLFQKIRIRVEREPPLPDQPFFLLFFYKIPDMILVIFGIVVSLQRMQQV